MTPFWKSKPASAPDNNGSPARIKSAPEINSAAKADEMPFRFQKPFAHMRYSMSPEECKVVDAIQARWEKEYDFYKDYAAPASEGQHHEDKVFNAVDGMQRALAAREEAPWKEWKHLEANFEKAVKQVREAFGEQRKYVEERWAEARGPANKDALRQSSEGTATETSTPATKYGGANDALQSELPPPRRSR